MRLAWSRSIAALFWFATAAYCLLSAIPFASEQFLKPGLAPALVTFANRHTWISAAALVATAAGLWPWVKGGHSGARAFIAVWAAALLIAPSLSTLEPTPAALTFSLLALVPPVWISLMDLRASAAEAAHPADDADVTRDYVACALAAVVVTAIHAVAAVRPVLPFGAATAGFGALNSLLRHLVVFSAVFAAICVIRGLSGLIGESGVFGLKPIAENAKSAEMLSGANVSLRTRRDLRLVSAEAWLARGAVATALGLFIFRIVLRPLALVGAPAAVAAAAFGAALAAALGPRGTRAPRGVLQALSGLVPGWAERSRMNAVVWLAIVALAICGLEQRAAISDWNFTVAKSAALASWLLVLAAALRFVPAGVQGPGFFPFAACYVVLALQVSSARAASASAADAWKERDPSVRLITDWLAPSAPASDEGLADFLQLHTNIPRSTHVAPVTIDLAALGGAPPAARPHIFLFVVDSLRRDYLSPYNRSVTFTPAFDRFARESTVFERAFTRYGATGLSVPSLWVGGLVLHKQYVTPFAPMNALAKLLEHERYQQWIGMDNILDVILPPTPRRTPLDAGIQVADFRFCRTLGEIRARLGGLAAGGPPAFVYSLPQDVHVSAITREGATPVDTASYGAFYAPYASRVRRLDACFGEFVDDLKTRGLFDRSIVVVTADHGDSLGEQGRMGHAYTIFPEIVQVPLIVHLPSDLRVTLRADTSSPAFTIDLTPTLYALLGQPPQPPAAFFGRPLFRKEGMPPPPRSIEPEVLASSYGSVYGALFDDARRLYIFDGIALREYSYAIDGTGAGRELAVSDDDRSRGQRAIRSTVEAIAKFYGYRP